MQVQRILLLCTRRSNPRVEALHFDLPVFRDSTRGLDLAAVPPSWRTDGLRLYHVGIILQGASSTATGITPPGQAHFLAG